METRNETWKAYTDIITKELEYFEPLECPSIKYMMVYPYNIPEERNAFLE